MFVLSEVRCPSNEVFAGGMSEAVSDVTQTTDG